MVTPLRQPKLTTEVSSDDLRLGRSDYLGQRLAARPRRQTRSRSQVVSTLSAKSMITSEPPMNTKVIGARAAKQEVVARAAMQRVVPGIPTISVSSPSEP